MADDDLGDLEEVEVLDAEETGASGAAELEAREVFRMWTRSYQAPHMSSFILDGDLRIVWVNPAFGGRFGSQGAERRLGLGALYPDSLSADRLSEAKRSLDSADQGHSWYGRVERKGADETTVIASIQVLPLFEDGSAFPSAFCGVIDDISA